MIEYSVTCKTKKKQICYIIKNIEVLNMSYEPGSLECRYLIEAKENLLNTVKALQKVKGLDVTADKLLIIYKELDERHDSRKIIESK